MRKTIKIAMLFILASSIINAQGIDKPQYRIAAYRAGILLGNIDIELFPFFAPLAANNFDSLALALAYDSTAFHRVVPGFVIQGGDPNSINGPISTWGNGNPNQPNVNAEFSVARHYRGRIGAARDTAINSASSQFYICAANALFLDGNYTVFGQTIAGLSVVDSIVNSPRDANDVPLQKITMFVTPLGSNPSVPPACTLTSPVDQSVGITKTQLFTWSLVTDAVINTAEFSTDSTFSVINNSVKAGINQVVSPILLSLTKYYWRVKSNNGGHESLYSNVFSFNTAIGLPNLVYPANQSTNIDTFPTFVWNSISGNVTYNLIVASSPTFNAQSTVFNQNGLIDTVQQVTGLVPNTLYYWKVNASDSTNIGLFAPRHTFVTIQTTSINEVTNDFKIDKIYPNPTTSELFIDVSTQTSSTITLSLTDLLGKTVKLENKLINPLVKTIKLEIDDVKTGNYILNVKKNNSVKSFNVEIVNR